MRLVPRSMAVRVLATLALAAVAVVVLDLSVKSADAQQRPRRTSLAAPALPPPVRLASVTGSILLATTLAAVPPDAAPVVQLFDDGGYALRRPSPVPQGPEMAVARPAIVLPTGQFSRLDSRARATFVEVVGALIAERPVTVDRFVTLGVPIESAALERVLAWVR